MLKVSSTQCSFTVGGIRLAAFRIFCGVLMSDNCLQKFLYKKFLLFAKYLTSKNISFEKKHIIVGVVLISQVYALILKVRSGVFKNSCWVNGELVE